MSPNNGYVRVTNDFPFWMPCWPYPQIDNNVDSLNRLHWQQLGQNEILHGDSTCQDYGRLRQSTSPAMLWEHPTQNVPPFERGLVDPAGFINDISCEPDDKVTAKEIYIYLLWLTFTRFVTPIQLLKEGKPQFVFRFFAQNKGLHPVCVCTPIGLTCPRLFQP